MGGKGSNTSTVTQNSAPPAYIQSAQQGVIGQAQNAASAPLQQYQGNMVAGFTPDQTAAMGTIDQTQGISNPYINSASQYFSAAGAPITTMNFQGADQLPASGMNLSNESANTNIAGAGSANLGTAGNYAANAGQTAGNYAAGAGLAATNTAAGAGQTANNYAAAGNQGAGNYASGALSTAQGAADSANNFATGAVNAAGTNVYGQLPQYNASTLAQYESPYTQSVVDATQAQFNNANAQQQQGVISNAIGAGAFGGDRASVAQALTAGQEQLAQAPVIAGLENTGYTNAQTELNAQQQLAASTLGQQAALQAQTGLGAANSAVSAGQLGANTGLGAANTTLSGAQLGANTGLGAGQLSTNADLSAGQLGSNTAISSGQLGSNTATTAAGLQQQAAQQQAVLQQGAAGQQLGEFNTLNQAQTGAQEASQYLASNAGSNMAALGTEAQNSALTGANAQLQSGALQQQLGQEQLNIPYEQFSAEQAYPYQNTDFLSGVVNGTNGGGTSSTTSPGASTASQIAGLGLTGLAGYGALSSAGLLGGAGSATALSDLGIAGLDTSGVDSSIAGLLGLAVNRGGRIGHDTGGSVNVSPLIPDASVSVIPQANQPRSGGVQIPHAPTAQQQPNPTAEGLQSLLMASKMPGAYSNLATGGRLGRDAGGSVPGGKGGGKGSQVSSGATGSPYQSAVPGGSPYQAQPAQQQYPTSGGKGGGQYGQPAYGQSQGGKGGSKYGGSPATQGNPYASGQSPYSSAYQGATSPTGGKGGAKSGSPGTGSQALGSLGASQPMQSATLGAPMQGTTSQGGQLSTATPTSAGAPPETSGAISGYTQAQGRPNIYIPQLSYNPQAAQPLSSNLTSNYAPPPVSSSPYTSTNYANGQPSGTTSVTPVQGANGQWAPPAPPPSATPAPTAASLSAQYGGDTSAATGSDLSGLYQGLLGRAPDPSGTGYFTGMPVDQVYNDILGSPEYQGLQPHASGGSVDPSDTFGHFDGGGLVSAGLESSGVPGASGMTPVSQGLNASFSAMPMLQLQETLTRLPPNSPYRPVAENALRQKQMTLGASPNGGGLSSPNAPQTPTTVSIGMNRGGSLPHFDDGGDVSDSDGPSIEVSGGDRPPEQIASLPTPVAVDSKFNAPPASLANPPPDLALSGTAPNALNVNGGAAPTPGPSSSAAASLPAYSPPERGSAQNLADSPWMALATAGLGMAAGQSPHALENIGAGGLQGVKYLENQQAEEQKENQAQQQAQYQNSDLTLRGKQVDNAATELQNNLQAHKDTMEIERQKLTQSGAELNESQREHDLAHQVALGDLGVRQAALQMGHYSGEAVKDQMGNPVGTNIIDTKTGDVKFIPNTNASTNPFGTSASGVPPNAAQQVTGPDYLATLPTGAAAQVKALAEGRQAFPTGMALKSPYWQNMLTATSQYDPTFDAVNYNGRAQTRKAFTSGQPAQAVTAMNTALGHAERLTNSFDALNNFGGIATPLNAPVNAIKGAFGSPTVTAADEDVDALAAEGRKVFANTGGGSLTELENWQKNFPRNGSPAQQHAAVGEFVNLLDSRLSSLADQYNRGMGTTQQPMQLLEPHAQAVYEKLTGNIPSNATGYQTGTQGKPNAGNSPSPAAAAPISPPEGAIKYLQLHPEVADQFNAKYGADAATTYLKQ